MKSGVFITKDALKRIQKAMETIPDMDVLVGIPSDKADREDGDPINNAELGYIHENGAPEVNIPARPWLVPGIREGSEKIAKYFEQAGKAALDGNFGLMGRALDAAGLSAQVAVKNKIFTGPFQALKESTLAARRAKGRTGIKPLIDSAEMLNSITYVVRKRK